ncbi:MAG: trehalose-6-phosphate synthase [Proteobacteria bacterium]|nr:trehalose-6-phosphate synthase [Pseudomonadota bacterium]
MTRSRGRLVVVANRGPYRMATQGSAVRLMRAAGGLVTALDPVLRDHGGVWVSGDEIQMNGAERGQVGYDLAHVSMTASQREGFYQGVSNAVLWPTLHSFPPTIRIGEAPWHDYVHANDMFAQSICHSSRPGDLVWVQDYHLMLVPAILRRRRPRARIGWFCHVPWPGPDLFAMLPWRGEILEGLLGADVIGFHCDSYAMNFLACAERVTDLRVDPARMTVRAGRRTVRVTVAPIGVPVDDIQTLASGPRVAAHVERIHHALGNRRIVLGVDRLDYTKGIPERILAYEQFLRSDRSIRNRYVFVQVMVPSRTDVRAYAELKAEIDRLVGSVNGQYSSTGRVAVHYLYRNLDQHALYAHYMAADVAFITPLRDGMNLVAQEYVVCHMNCDGVLVLSEFAGAADYLTDALTVNPHDIDALAGVLKRALSMPHDEVRQRMTNLRNVVHKLDVHRWADTFLSNIERPL